MYEEGLIPLSDLKLLRLNRRKHVSDANILLIDRTINSIRSHTRQKKLRYRENSRIGSSKKAGPHSMQDLSQSEEESLKTPNSLVNGLRPCDLYHRETQTTHSMTFQHSPEGVMDHESSSLQSSTGKNLKEDFGSQSIACQTLQAFPCRKSSHTTSKVLMTFHYENPSDIKSFVSEAFEANIPPDTSVQDNKSSSILSGTSDKFSGKQYSEDVDIEVQQLLKLKELREFRKHMNAMMAGT